jgi:ATP-dependent DNA ligase
MLWRSSSPVRHPPGFVEPCLPTLGHIVPTGPRWAYEMPTIAKALAALRVKSVTLDGEGVVCREDGVSDFDRLRMAVDRMGSRDAFL